MKQYSTGQISRAVNGKLDGSPNIMITGVEQISRVTANQLTFIAEKKYKKLWDKSLASAAIVNDSLGVQARQGRALIRVADANLALVDALRLFDAIPPDCGPGIHPAAQVDSTAKIGEHTEIGAGCYIGPGVVVGANTRIYPNVTVLDNSIIGSDTTIWPGTVVRERCRIGNHCVIHPNVTIGADGFGYRPSPDGQGLVKIPQIGTVEIGDNVEIGAGSCVDRGKFGATSIGDGTKIDNLVQIAHNCRIGRFCVMAGQSGIAGSVTLGEGVVMGGGARVKDNVTVGDGVRLGGNSGVISDVAPGKTLLGVPADDYKQTLRIWAAQKKLPDLVKKMKRK